MDSRINKSLKRHHCIQDPMVKKILKTIPYFKENIPEHSLNDTSLFTSGLKKVLGAYY